MAAIDIDIIRAAAAREDLAIEVVDETGSTNRVLMDAAFGAAPASPRLFAAARQTAGRGRRGRDWLMEPGRSAAFSIALERAAMPGVAAVGLPIAVGIAVAQALAPMAAGIQLKWPNDLQRAGRKFGGILVESRRGPAGAGGALERFVVGIGLNLLPPRDASARIAQPVTGLFDEAAEGAHGNPAAEFVIGRAAGAAVAAVMRFLDEGLGPFREAWNQVDALRGQRVALMFDGRIEAEGIARGIACDGALLLETPSGIRSVASGDVSVRPLAPAPLAS